MQSRVRLGTIALLAGMVALLVVVAIASRAGHSPGSKGQLWALSPTAFDYVLTIMIVLGSALLVVLFRAALQLYRTGFRTADFRDRGHGSLFRSMTGLVAFMLIVALFLKAVGTTHNKTLLKLLQPAGKQSPSSPLSGTAHTVEFRWQGALIAVMAILAVATFVMVRRRGPDVKPLSLPGWRGVRPPGTGDTAEVRDDLLGAFDHSLDDLDKEPDPRRAVIAAYARAERVLEEHGFGRHPSETPFEYLRRVLALVRVRPQAALELADLFERAKFSRREIDHGMRQDAVAALRAVREDLEPAT